ncbi:hypothetical protein SARC_09783 [Sphaeroforma arctica JP610]|uniref:PHD-type domain-containing protein n=1 Tax=Sphaeroforma arctica JP610 TaxID=667725 RepID=A0A0L0FLV7_9EUKA|nr:hypothetical protein SARC_09783 [Sphaeroforma arctica JP610]KNC77762.1 hypothetical protein SARC_09783 [Sphaeroforma arctica JP610]|eukprot:XP_014151664.1 hypothetical protein SARC_09783 [Sphaeroforma arctica JP610]
MSAMPPIDATDIPSNIEVPKINRNLPTTVHEDAENTNADLSVSAKDEGECDTKVTTQDSESAPAHESVDIPGEQVGKLLEQYVEEMGSDSPPMGIRLPHVAMTRMAVDKDGDGHESNPSVLDSTPFTTGRAPPVVNKAASGAQTVGSPENVSALGAVPTVGSLNCGTGIAGYEEIMAMDVHPHKEEATATVDAVPDENELASAHGHTDERPTAVSPTGPSSSGAALTRDIAENLPKSQTYKHSQPPLPCSQADAIDTQAKSDACDSIDMPVESDADSNAQSNGTSGSESEGEGENEAEDEDGEKAENEAENEDGDEGDEGDAADCAVVAMETEEDTPNANGNAKDTGGVSLAESIALAKIEAQRARRREKNREYRERKRRKERDAMARELQRKVEKAEAHKQRQQKLEEEKLASQRLRDERFCFCRKPYNENVFMIACDSCDEWFHSRCINTTDRALRNVDAFYCPQCLENNRYLFIRYSKVPQNYSDDEVDVDVSSTGSKPDHSDTALEVSAAAQITKDTAHEPSPMPTAAEEKPCLYHKCTRSAGPRTKYCSHQCALLTNALRIRAMIRLAKAAHAAQSNAPTTPHTQAHAQTHAQRSTHTPSHSPTAAQAQPHTKLRPHTYTHTHTPSRVQAHPQASSHALGRSHPYARASGSVKERRDAEHKQRMAEITAERCRIKRSIESYERLEQLLSQIVDEGKEAHTDTAEDTGDAAPNDQPTIGAKANEESRQETAVNKGETAPSATAEGAVTVPLEDSVMCSMCGSTLKTTMMARHLFACFTKNEALQVPQALYNAFPYTHMSESFCQNNGKSSEQIRCHHLRNTCPLHSRYRMKVKVTSGRKGTIECAYPLGIDVDSLLHKVNNNEAVSTAYARCTEVCA